MINLHTPCNRCGKDMPIKPNPTIFEMGFRREEILLCESCLSETKKKEKLINEKYKRKLIKIMNEYFRKVLE